MTSFSLNGLKITAESSPDTPLLWVVRDELKLKGSKYGCGAGLCGACTMLIDGVATRTCILPLAAVEDKEVVTIEGLGTPANPHPLQKAWVEHNVPQCGYCQSGQIMSAAGLLQANPNPSEAEVTKAMEGNICRCGCYGRIKDAVLTAASSSTAQPIVVDPKEVVAP
ncbi:MAG: (2Fe-2S)-binding protein [Pseudomonadota bacterium]